MQKNILNSITYLSLLYASSAFAQTYPNSLGIQYGLAQYNYQQNEILKNQNPLSVGVTYAHQLNGASGLNLTGRYYQWNLQEIGKLTTYAAQAMFVFRPKRISAGWSTRWMTPYLGIGAGYEQHHLKVAQDSVSNNLYFPLELGLLFNLSKKWSLGIFGEYKFTKDTDFKTLIQKPTKGLDLVNTAGVSLQYHFGRGKSVMSVPIVFTDPNRTTIPLPNTDTLASTDVKQSVDTVASIPRSVIVPTKDSIQKEVAVVKDSVSKVVAKPTVILKDTIQKVAVVKDSVSKVVEKPTVILKDTVQKGVTVVKEAERRVDTLLQVVQKPPIIAKDTIQKVVVIENVRKVDSLEKVVATLKEQLRIAAAEAAKPRVPSRDTVLMQIVETGDKPEIAQLKRSYNVMSDALAKSKQQGKENEIELQNLRGETAQLYQKIQILSKDKTLTDNKLQELYTEMRLLQVEVARKNQVITTQASPNPVQAPTTVIIKSENDKPRNEAVDNSNMLLLRQDMIHLQSQLDKALTQLEIIKVQATNPQVKEENNVVLAQLLKKQAQIETDLKKLEQQNTQLVQVMRTMSTQKDTVIVKTTERIEVTPPVTTQRNDYKSTTDMDYMVHFGNNSSVVGKQYLEMLKNVAEIVGRAPNKMILLSGFTDKTGNSGHNLELSERRVKAVKTELMRLGLKNEIFFEKYLGSDKATNVVSEMDRKVVIKIIQQ
jgi:outer membrane protein OmpA-like peptidoglycan-associated protein/opacity protein-like surface antigen